MKNNEKIKSIFNFLSKPAKQDFTLGRVWASTLKGANMSTYEDNFFKRGGRAVERTVTIGGIFAAVATGAASGFLPIVGAMTVSKIAGVIAGYGTDEAIRSINNKLKSKTP